MSYDKVVVLVTPEYGFESERGLHLARFAKLSMISYGVSKEDALVNLKELLRAFIQRSRESGILDDRLDKAGVRWFSETDARVRGLSYEDLAPNSVPPTLSWESGELPLAA